ncbi:MAG TPA: dihydrolipoamide succinyltransferase, partial [Frankiaceae bacterium]|nr:dihydrolipoamide succinyltransferase [Frankiaceae bacterium]
VAAAAAPGGADPPGPPQPPVRPAGSDPMNSQPVTATAAPAPEPAPEPEPRTVPAHPLGVPAAAAGPGAPQGAFPVAPLLRDRD